MSYQQDINKKNRFEFGKNWSIFLNSLNDERISLAEQSLLKKLNLRTLEGKTFLDIGSGSGLFSLAAKRLGASVHSFDFDPHSVNCTTELKAKYFPNDENWVIETASVLDNQYMNALPAFDIVYSWGVLHHTGDLDNALHNTVKKVKDQGSLFIAIYNDQGNKSARWLKIKQGYNYMPYGLKWIIWIPMLIRIWWRATLKDFLKGKPFYTWKHYAEFESRGMTPFRDLLDWVGGLPFEVASPEKIFNFYKDKNFQLSMLKTCGGGLGCNEFVFRKNKAK
jgi:SAM-dependent methyltransferase